MRFAVVTYYKRGSNVGRRDWFDISTSEGQKRKEACINNPRNLVMFIDHTNSPKYVTGHGTR